jgi:hypothetical protein
MNGMRTFVYGKAIYFFPRRDFCSNLLPRSGDYGLAMHLNACGSRKSLESIRRPPCAAKTKPACGESAQIVRLGIHLVRSMPDGFVYRRVNDHNQVRVGSIAKNRPLSISWRDFLPPVSLRPAPEEAHYESSE